MGVSVGIVGLPNAGKSTLFNALTHAGAQVGNYPFTTIEPNTGIVSVPDSRIDQLAELFHPPKTVPATVTFTDIAGLVRGASKGEGLGNQFLGHIRECDAIALVVRDFRDDDVVHVDGSVDPVRDIGVIELELQLADLDTVSKRLERIEKAARLQKEKSAETIAVYKKLQAHLETGSSVRTLSLLPEERSLSRDLFLLTGLPLMVVVNVAEDGQTAVDERILARAREAGGNAIAISARIESEIAELEPSEQAEFLESIGLHEPGLHRLAHDAYDLLGLITFFTAGEKEVRAWTVQTGATALDAAGTIHTDFAKGFIRAEVIDWRELVDAGSYAAARDAGKQRLEGRDYIVHDGDVMHFRFNV